MELTALSRSCGTERNVLVYFLALQPPLHRFTFHCLLALLLNLGHPRISVSLILTGTPERPLSGPDLLGASTKHSQLRHKWTSCLSPLSSSSYQGPGCLLVLHAVWALSWVRVWKASGQAGVRKPPSWAPAALTLSCHFPRRWKGASVNWNGSDPIL